jgi:hypothetical protein
MGVALKLAVSLTQEFKVQILMSLYLPIAFMLQFFYLNRYICRVYPTFAFA